MTKAEGAALHAFHEKLLELDPGRVFGGLQRVLTPTGDYLWLCPDHREEFEPGMPDLGY